MTFLPVVMKVVGRRVAARRPDDLAEAGLSGPAVILRGLATREATAQAREIAP